MYVMIQITAVALICWLLIGFLKHTSPHIVQKIISASLFFCLIAPILASFNASFQVQTSSLLSTEALELGHFQPLVTEVNPLVKQQITSPSQLNQTKSNLPFDFDWRTLMISIWLLGIMFMLYRHSKSIVYIKQMIKNADSLDLNLQQEVQIEKKVNILQSELARIPFLYVASELYIVLPAQSSEWKTNNLNDVIQHELCHYRRKDHWLVWLSLLVSTIYWFHPLIRLLLSKQRQYIELACDQQLLAEGINKHSYAESLMLVTTNYKQAPIIIEMASKPHLLSSRIQSIISGQPEVTPFKHKCIIAVGMAFLFTAGCVEVDQSETLEMSDLVELVSHDLPLIRDEKVPKGDLHLSAFYDGYDHQNTYFQLQLENQKKQKVWISFGPLRKFTDHIHTWHLKLSNGVELTGKYRVFGVEPDGVVDGIAIGLVSQSHKGEYKILKSQGPIIGEVPNVLCSWPLWMGERKFNKVLPQLTHSQPESVQRLLCGSQLMGNGTHLFLF